MEFAHRRLLVVDDNPAIHEDYRKVLLPEDSDSVLRQAEAAFFADEDAVDVSESGLEGVDVTHAYQGEEAVQLTRDALSTGTPFSVAFVDMRMPPGWDGLRTSQELWNVDPDLQLIICTAYSDKSWSKICETLGRTDKLLILKKPFDAAEVMQLTVALTEKWRLARESRLTKQRTEMLIHERTSQLRQTKETLRENNQRLEMAINVANLGYWTLDASTGEMMWSKEARELFGYAATGSPTSSVDGMLEAIHPTDRTKAANAISECIESELSQEFRCAVVDNASESNEGLRHIHTKIRCVKDADQKLTSLFGMIQDVSEHEKALLTIKHASLHDDLTGLPNRTKFHERLCDSLQQYQRTGGGVAIVLLNIDGFSEVNDSQGHTVGDEVLRQLGERLAKCCRENEFIACLGGDEFGFVVSDAALPQDASSLAERVSMTLANSFDADGQAVELHASVGIALAPTDGLEADHLLKNAFLALHRAKQEGHGACCFFESSIDAKVRTRRELKDELSHALQREQLELFYQPVMKASDRSLCGFEALLRWEHPTRGRVMPMDFIPIAEETGLIRPMGAWVLKQACHQAMSWPQEVRIAVNVSVVQFDAELVPMVKEALQSTGIEPSRVELEITESLFLKDSEENMAFLRDLKQLGVRIAMDDFGIGFSSLSYLRQFPFDKLKLDRAFVRDLVENQESQAIISAIAGLGNSMKIETTAEGVETEEQLRHLRDEGYDYVQGYLFAKPLSFADACEFVSSGELASAEP